MIINITNNTKAAIDSHNWVLIADSNISLTNTAPKTIGICIIDENRVKIPKAIIMPPTIWANVT